jgi:hypothetical protein
MSWRIGSPIQGGTGSTATMRKAYDVGIHRHLTWRNEGG